MPPRMRRMLALGIALVALGETLVVHWLWTAFGDEATGGLGVAGLAGGVAMFGAVPRSQGRGERRTRASSQSSSSVVDPNLPQVFHEVVRNKAARAKMDAVTSPRRKQSPAGARVAGPSPAHKARL